MKKKLKAPLVSAGAVIWDEWSQAQAALFHAFALRCAYVRQARYSFDINDYAQTKETCGRATFVAVCRDQLPPVPKASSLMPPLEPASPGHRAGAAILANLEHMFVMKTAMRFTDDMLVAILSQMRTQGGVKVSDEPFIFF